jgi:hypothetical protein
MCLRNMIITVYIRKSLFQMPINCGIVAVVSLPNAHAFSYEGLSA